MICCRRVGVGVLYPCSKTRSGSDFAFSFLLILRDLLVGNEITQGWGTSPNRKSLLFHGHSVYML